MPGQRQILDANGEPYDRGDREQLQCYLPGLLKPALTGVHDADVEFSHSDIRELRVGA